MGCTSDSSNSSASSGSYQYTFKPLVIKKGPGSWPVNIRLAIQTTTDTDTTRAYKLISSYEGRPLGLILVVPRDDNGKATGSKGFLISLGPPSDFFLQAVARLYKQPVDSSAKLADSSSFICMNLNEIYNRQAGQTGETYVVAAEYKLFFNAESENGEAEMLMNINPGEQWVELAEKDKDYRPGLIHFFTHH